MKNNILKTKYNILVLLDLSQESEITLSSAINLAKAINGDIELFYIKPALDIVKNENQLSAMSAIDKESFMIKKKMKTLINHVSLGNNIPINYRFAFGNVKKEIANKLEKSNPDIVVMGKRIAKPLNFLGNDVTQFMLNNYTGNIFIAGEDKMLQTNTNMSIGFYNDILDEQSIDITKKLSKQAKSPIKFFRVRKNSDTISNSIKSYSSNNENNFKNTIEYVFEQGSNALDGLVNYVSINEIDLLCLGRGSKNKDENYMFTDGMFEVQKVIQKLKIPLLIMQNRA